jgi:hypothetical protein
LSNRPFIDVKTVKDAVAQYAQQYAQATAADVARMNEVMWGGPDYHDIPLVAPTQRPEEGA